MADDRLDAAAAVNTLVWLYLRQGLLDDARQLATSWADEIEPRFSRATTAELTLWGRLLLGISNAAVRDNRPGEAEDSIKLARAAAARIGHEALSDTSTTRTFGPVTVAMIHAENAAVMGQPDRVLSIAERIPTTVLHANSASRNRHRLDVASALTSTRKHPEALAVLQDLATILARDHNIPPTFTPSPLAPPWCPCTTGSWPARTVPTSGGSARNPAAAVALCSPTPRRRTQPPPGSLSTTGSSAPAPWSSSCLAR